MPMKTGPLFRSHRFTGGENIGELAFCIALRQLTHTRPVQTPSRLTVSSLEAKSSGLPIPLIVAIGLATITLGRGSQRFVFYSHQLPASLPLTH